MLLLVDNQALPKPRRLAFIVREHSRDIKSDGDVYFIFILYLDALQTLAFANPFEHFRNTIAFDENILMFTKF